MKKRIAVDCDEVLIETAPFIINEYNRLYGTTLTLQDYYTRDLDRWDVKDDKTGIARVEAIAKTPEHLQLPPFQESITAIKKLAQHYELHVVTGRPNFLAAATQAILDQHFPGLFKSVEFTHFFSEKARSKVDVCQALGADILIDDFLHHAESVARCGIQVLLFGDYPWNQTETLPQNIERVKDWSAVVTRLLPEPTLLPS